MIQAVNSSVIPTGGEAEGRLTLRFPALSENGNDVRREQILRHMGSDWRLLLLSTQPPLPLVA